jgi:hypothetical protein
MTIEIRQLVIRAVVSEPAPSSSTSNDSVLVDRCVRAVLRKLDQRKER